ELVRMLAKLRLRSDIEAGSKGVTEDVVDGFSQEELAALPESAIVHIADAYFILKKKDVPDQEIFNRIDMQRSLFGSDAALSADINLGKYIKRRLKAEFPQLTSLEEKIVDMEILYAVKWFSRTSTSREDWKDVDDFAAKAIATTRGKYLDTQAMARAEIEEAIARPSGGKWKWLVIGLIVVAIAGAAAYWLFFMGGMELFK
ncbi:MAG: hypothetical protein ACE5F3_07380, partial [Mariprofundaceae bacterium]